MSGSEKKTTRKKVDEGKTRQETGDRRQPSTRTTYYYSNTTTTTYSGTTGYEVATISTTSKVEITVVVSQSHTLSTLTETLSAPEPTIRHVAASGIDPLLFPKLI